MSASPDLQPLDLEQQEHRVLLLVGEGARPDSARWAQLLPELEALPGREPPLLDPDAARQSSAELRQLVHTLSGHVQPAASPPERPTETRAGYSIVGAPGSEAAQVHPSFAEALAHHEPLAGLRARFDDLWAVDASLWFKLAQPSETPTSIARAWLTSPGRRLVQELTAIKRAPSPTALGASDFSWAGLCGAAGPLPGTAQTGTEQLASWRELHAAVPGLVLSEWSPAQADVTAVLRILKGRRGDPVFLRGAALSWLLRRAATEPFYDLDGLRRDLRTDLTPALVSAFPEPESPHHTDLRASSRLELAALQNAARVTAEADKPLSEALPRAWSLARWIQSCAFRSPFFGGDEEALAARLRVLLPGAPRPAALKDILDPSRFRDDGTGLALEELALIAGLIEHYEGSGPVLLPTPTPLVHALRRLARRTLRPLEREAEELLASLHMEAGAISQLSSPESPVPVAHERQVVAREGNWMGWRGPHIAPPLAARWLMTLRNIPWLAECSEVWEESLAYFEHEPARHVWVAFAVYREREALPEPLQKRVADSWRRVLVATNGKLGREGALALMAVAVLPQLTEDEAHVVVDRAVESAPDWRHHVLEALALAAERSQRFSLWSLALESLLTMMGEQGLDEKERLKAAFLALRRVSALSATRPERAPFLERIASAVSRAPFSQYVDLRRELRRLGLAAPTATGGGR